MSKRIRNEFVVGCTQEEAFDFLSDLRNEMKWNPEQCESVKKTTDGPVGLGTKYLAKWKGGPEIEVVYTEFEHPNSWRAHSEGAMESRFECSVEAHPEGAKIISDLELIPHGFFKLLFPIFKLMSKNWENTGPEKMRAALHDHYGIAAAAE